MPVPKWVSDLPSRVAGSVVTTILFAGAAAVWGALKVYATATQLGTPIALGFGVAIFFAVVGSWNYLQQIDARAKQKRLANRSPAAIAEQIRQWLWRYRFSATDSPRPGADFAMDADNTDKTPVTIIKLSQNPWVTVAATLQIHPDHRAAVNRNAQLFGADLVIALIQLGVEYEVVIDQGVITGMSINQSVWFDEKMNDLSFLHSIMAVRRGLRLANTMVSRVNLIETPKKPPASQP